MRFRQRSEGSQMPEVNLVPMMDVLMTVLTFFILISMTLSGQPMMNVILPLLQGEQGAEKAPKPEKLVVGLDNQGQILLDSKTVTIDQMAEQVVSFLEKHPEGSVVLKADSKLKYDKVVQMLEVMRDIGGDQVSLAIDRKQ